MNIAVCGVAIVLMATLGSLVIVRRNSPQQPIQVKAVLFGLYFWGLVFLQLVVFGLFMG
ncbi:MAG: hypothetical protein Q7T96_13305 [Methylobacter sp.]|uniref:hypothetical protein n=1 Tax=Methylobacter sp. TaxID=2051955 RepID=UPI0027274D77|nr:hypothetical protein [Methylobacter sp.]MDO9270077.1 hypothetical protein [Methylobacter sp.]MDP1665754.1 hypothetical protein [Methylobacter sp.]MDP1970143.1 hypothetical protein [Methylobacter sp.]